MQYILTFVNWRAQDACIFRSFLMKSTLSKTSCIALHTDNIYSLPLWPWYVHVRVCLMIRSGYCWRLFSSSCTFYCCLRNQHHIIMLAGIRIQIRRRCQTWVGKVRYMGICYFLLHCTFSVLSIHSTHKKLMFYVHKPVNISSFIKPIAVAVVCFWT